MPTEQEIRIKLIAEAQNLIAGLKQGETATDKLKLAIVSLEAANKQVAEAEQKLEKARESGNSKAIKQAEKQLEAKAKIAIQAEKDVERQVTLIQRTIAQEEKASEKSQALAEKEASQRQKAEEAKRQSIEKTQETQIKSLETVAKSANAAFEALATGGNPLKSLEKGFEAIGQLAGNIPGLGALGGKFAEISAAGIKLTETFAEITREAIESQKQIDQLTTTTGVNATTISALRVAADQIGQSFVQVVGAIDLTAEAVNRAREGVKKDVAVFEALKVPLSDLNGNQRSLNDILDDTIVKFGALEAGTEKAGIGYKLFGLRAQKVIDQAAPAFEQLKEKIRESGIVLDKISATKLRDLSLDLVDIQTKLTGLRNIVGAEFADEFSDIARNASQAFKEFRDNVDIREGLQVTLQVVQRLVQVIGNTLVDVVKGAGRVLAGFGNTLAELPESVQKFLGINKDLIEGLKNAGQATQDLANGGINLAIANEATGKSIDALGEKVKALTQEQEIQTKNLSIQAEKEIADIQKKVQQKIISETRGEEEIAAINNRLARLQENNARRVSVLVENEIRTKQQALSQQIENSQNAEIEIARNIEKFRSERVENEKLAQALLLDAENKAAQERNKILANAAFDSKAATDRQIQRVQDELNAAKQGYQQILFDNQKKNENLEKQEESAKEKTKEKIAELAEFNKIIDTKTILDASITNEKLIKFRQGVAEANQNLAKATNEVEIKGIEGVEKVAKAKLEERKKDLEIEVNDAKQRSQELLQNITGNTVEDAKRRSEAIKKPIEVEINGLQEILKETKVVGKDREDIEKKISALKAELAKKEKDEAKSVAEAQKKADQERASSLENAIKERNALTKAANEEEKQGIQELVDQFTKGQLSKEEALRKAFLLELELTEKSLANQKSNLSDLTTQKALGKDVEDKIIAANEEITRLQREEIALQKALKGEIDNTSESVNKVTNGFKDSDKNASKSKESIKSNEKAVDDLNSAIQKTAGKILSIKQNFDASKASVEELKQQIIDLRADADSIRFSATLAFPGKDAVVKSFEDTAEAIEKILTEKITKEEFERFKETQEKELAERRKAATEAVDIARNLEKELQKLLEDSKEKRKEINEEIKQNASDKKTTLENLAIEQGENLKKFDEKQAQEELERQESKNQRKLQKELSFQEKLLNIKSNFEKEKTQAEEESLGKRANLEKEINELLAKRATASPEDKTKIDEEIKKKRKELSDLDEGDKARLARETKKGDEIEKARKDADEKRKNAKTSEELEQIEKELSIQIEGIDKKFDIEEKAEEELKKFRGKVSEETLAAIIANFEKQKQQAEQFAKEKLEIERKRFVAEQAARDAALAKEKADNEQRRKDFLDQQKKEFDDRAKSFDDKDKQLREALKKEKEEYKKHVDELRTKTAESLAEIAKSFTDGGAAAEKFFVDFAKNAGLTGKAIDDILKKLKQFKAEVASDNQQTNSASSSPGNPSSTNTNQNNSNNNGGGVFSSSNTNNQGGTTPGINTNPTAPPPNNKGIEKQPQSDKPGGQQPGGVKLPEGKTDQPSNDVDIPGLIQNASEYSKTANEIYKKFDEHLGGKNINSYTKAQKETLTNLGNKLIRATTNYAENAKLDQASVGLALQQSPNLYNFAKADKNKADFDNQVKALIKFVEANRKSEGKIKANPTDNITDVTPTDPGGSGGVGNGNSDKGNDGFGPKDKPEVPSQAPVARGRDLTPEELALARARDSIRTGDGEGAEKKGFVNIEADAAVKGTKPNNTNTNSNPNNSSQTAPGATSNQSPSTANKQRTSNNPNGNTSNNPNNNTNNNSSNNPNNTSNNPTDNAQVSTQISQTNNSEVIINFYSQGFLGDKNTVNQLKGLFSDLANERDEINQGRLRSLNGPNLARRG